MVRARIRYASHVVWTVVDNTAMAINDWRVHRVTNPSLHRGSSTLGQKARHGTKWNQWFPKPTGTLRHSILSDYRVFTVNSPILPRENELIPPIRNNFPPALVMMAVIPEEKLLPQENWEHIASLVAKEFPDLLTMKLTCKFFRSVAESDEVYKHARLVKLPPFACLYFLDKSGRRLIKRCMQSWNPEAMFLKGHQQYFSVGKEALGLELLSAVALNGHVESKYLNAMLLMCNEEGEESRRRGADSFKKVNASGELRKCRQRIRGLLGCVWWVENTPSTPEQPASCRSATCPTCGSMSERYCEHHLNPHDTGDVDVQCDYCRADYELLVFSEMLSAEED
ncbi:hypothetical protein PIB30_071277 [Stylosanthes scabra]|uniref:At2g35280-like TPR domain-containing protein n=1 Tax=Stylosanthes scabra TaxID=79078 RepID=A0ABU6WNL4_9FABA|nr:hypothetical protein [Stylosanthes scabra]